MKKDLYYPIYRPFKSGNTPLLVLLFLMTFSLKCFATPAPFEEAHALWIGPEGYHFQRLKEGGSKQKGFIGGGRIGYDHIKRYRLYWGANLLYAEGRLTGKNSSGLSLKSNLTDLVIEGRLGYTLQCGYWRKPYFTPYVGIGYFDETNHFKSPSPLTVEYNDTFKYATAGFFSGLELNPMTIFGINAKAKLPLNGKSHISGDPDEDDVTILMEDKLQFRVEVPLHFQNLLNRCRLQGSVIPFYEFRHFGGRENFPFDFIDTKFHLWGLQLEIAYRF